jgi:hypothetical protein
MSNTLAGDVEALDESNITTRIIVDLNNVYGTCLQTRRPSQVFESFQIVRFSIQVFSLVTSPA